MSSYLVRTKDFRIRRGGKTEHVLIRQNKSVDDDFVEIYKKCKRRNFILTVQLEFKDNKEGGVVKKMYPNGVHVYNQETARRVIFKDSVKPNVIVDNPCGPIFDTEVTRRYHTMVGYGSHGHYQRWISDNVNAMALERWKNRCLSTLYFSGAVYDKQAIPVRALIRDLPEDFWYLLVMGAYEPSDNFHKVIDAFIHYMDSCEDKPGGIGFCIFLGKYDDRNIKHFDYKLKIEAHANDSAYGDHFIFLLKEKSRRTRSLISQSSCAVYLRGSVRCINTDIEECLRAGTQVILVRFGPEVDFIQEHNCGVLIRKASVLRIAHAIEKAMHPIWFCEHCINARRYYLRHMTKFFLCITQLKREDENECREIVPFIRTARSWPFTEVERNSEDLQPRSNDPPVVFEFDESDDEVNFYFRVSDTPSDGYSSFGFATDWYIPPSSTSEDDDTDEEL